VSISCLCLRSITICPTRLLSRENAGVSYAPVVTFASAGTRENDVVVPNFFPAVRAMLDADLPSSDEIRSNFAAAGFAPRHHEIVTEVVAPDWPSFVRKSALRADSFLARLSDTEFDQGMAALRAHRANINPAEAVTEEIDWFVFKKRA
jgi:hypothetical protein